MACPGWTWCTEYTAGTSSKLSARVAAGILPPPRSYPLHVQSYLPPPLNAVLLCDAQRLASARLPPRSWSSSRLLRSPVSPPRSRSSSRFLSPAPLRIANSANSRRSRVLRPARRLQAHPPRPHPATTPPPPPLALPRRAPPVHRHPPRRARPGRRRARARAERQPLRQRQHEPRCRDHIHRQRRGPRRAAQVERAPPPDTGPEAHAVPEGPPRAVRRQRVVQGEGAV